eukprot:gene11925-8206_t
MLQEVYRHRESTSAATERSPARAEKALSLSGWECCSVCYFIHPESLFTLPFDMAYWVTNTRRTTAVWAGLISLFIRIFLLCLKPPFFFVDLLWLVGSCVRLLFNYYWMDVFAPCCSVQHEQ